MNLEKKFGISKNVFVMGVVSFFNDVASEMIYPLVPIFLSSVLGAPVAVIGLIEGIAESTASLLKAASGWYSDKLQKRKNFVILGYSLSSLSRPILALAFGWPVVLLGRFADRLGKGIRTSPRDALIAESSTEENRGKAFGFHRSLDTLGAVVGPLLALLLLHSTQNNFRLIFLLAFIPGVIGVILLLLFIKEQKRAKNEKLQIKGSFSELPVSFKIFLFISIIFAIGNSSDAFLILRAQNLGFTVTATLLAYVSFNLAYALLATPLGIVSDRIGSKKVLLTGFLFFAGVYLFFGLIEDSRMLWVLFPLYGIYMALTEGVGKAYISNLVPKERLGTAFGIYQMAIGICTFFASLIAGILWDTLGVGAPFLFGSSLALVAGFLFLVLGRKLKLQY